MGIRASYRRVDMDDLLYLLQHPETSDSFFGVNWEEGMEDLDDDDFISFEESLSSKGLYLDIDNDWHAIHFLLTGDHATDLKSASLPPLRNLVVGGTETPFNATYGKVRYLVPKEVQDLVDVLNQISTDSLKERLDPNLFNEAGIYPFGRQRKWNTEKLNRIAEKTYPKLVDFLRAAAQERNAILLALN